VVLIHQELSLAPEMTAAENIYLGELPRKTLGFRGLEKLLNAAPTRS
jgi:ABC-type sugar transport system ATPase subunit